ncbi:MAG: hypothetical protein KDA89_18055 [Planctomycetaceae bacterium]|nr:hypothetical protein [Planctomycetaceae bacterium]
MEHSGAAPHLVKGLRHLLADITQTGDGVPRGLNDVVLADTRLLGFEDSGVDYCGVTVEDLCLDGTFEQAAWLLLHQGLPDADETADLAAVIADSAVLDQPIADTIASIPLQTRPLDLLPLCTSLLCCFDPTTFDRTLESSRSQFWRLLARIPVLLHVAFGGQLQEGRVVVDGDSGNMRSLTFAGRLLQILRDDNAAPTPTEEQVMNAVMICECLTEMRPACFVARVFGSTVTDIVAAVKAASSMFTAQLRNDPFEWTAHKLKSFQSPDQAESWWNRRRPRVMPFGFTSDPEEPRTGLLREQCRRLLGSLDALITEASAARLESLLAAQGLFPTPDWTAARALTLLNVPADRIAVAVGIARMTGWAAQCVEQHQAALPLLPVLRYPGRSQSD